MTTSAETPLRRRRIGFAWFSIFGGTALWLQRFSGADLGPVLESGYENVLFAVFSYLPLGATMSAIALALVAIFFVTSADSAFLVLASMSSEQPGDPPMRRRLAWGMAIALVAGTLLLAGGLGALQGLVTVSALPFALLLVLVALALRRVLVRTMQVRQRRAQRMRHALEDWLLGRPRRGEAAVGTGDTGGPPAGTP